MKRLLIAAVFLAGVGAAQAQVIPSGPIIFTPAPGSAAGGGGTVTSVSNSDGTLALSPNPIIGAGTVSLALSHANIWSGVQSFTDGDLVLLGSGSGSSTLKAPATGGGTATLPAGSGALVYSSGAVTSIIGTANQITASASTGAVTLSLPNTLIIPGTLEVTSGATFDSTFLGKGMVTINLNAAPAPAPITGAVVQVVGADAANGFIENDTFGATPIFTGRRADGTGASPTAVQSAEALAGFSARPYDGTSYTSASTGNVQAVASENFSGTNHGTDLVGNCTAITTTTPAECWRAKSSGFTIPTGSTYQINGTQITTAALSNSANIPLLNAANTFTAAQTANSFIPTSSIVPTNGMYLSASNTLNFATNSTVGLTLSSAQALTVAGNITMGGSGNLSFSNTSAQIGLRNNATFISSPATSTIQFGQAAVDTGPVAQTLRTQGTLAGGTADVAGANFTFIISPGKGTGAGGSFIVQTAPAGSTGTVVGTPTTALTIDSTQKASFTGQIVVANMTQTAAAQSGTVCWAAAGLTYDATLGCLASLPELKDIRGQISNVWDNIDKIKPYWFSWKRGTPEWEGGDRAIQPGFNAREIAAIPNIGEWLTAKGPDGKLRGVRYMEMVAYLQAEIITLKGANDHLRAANDNDHRDISILKANFDRLERGLRTK